MTADASTGSPDLEAVGVHYAVDRLLDMRLRTRQAVHAIAERVRPGMAEEDAAAAARDILGEYGMRKGWHRVITRFGPNTTKDFMAQSEKGVVLGEDDIFFIDIGPIYQDIEGDAGETFVVGDDPEHHRARSDVRAIWEDVRARWVETGSSGRELYDVAQSVSRARGWELNLDLSGHRLSDFPHEAIYEGPLADVDFRPNPNLWVLEIAIRHPTRNFGAFYEDLLLADQSFPEWVFTDRTIRG